MTNYPDPTTDDLLAADADYSLWASVEITDEDLDEMAAYYGEA